MVVKTWPFTFEGHTVRVSSHVQSSALVWSSVPQCVLFFFRLFGAKINRFLAPPGRWSVNCRTSWFQLLEMYFCDLLMTLTFDPATCSTTIYSESFWLLLPKPVMLKPHWLAGLDQFVIGCRFRFFFSWVLFVTSTHEATSSLCYESWFVIFTPFVLNPCASYVSCTFYFLHLFCWFCKQTKLFHQWIFLSSAPSYAKICNRIF